MRFFRVATFYNPRAGDVRPLRSRVHAYTQHFNPTWEGCRVYQVRTHTAKEAKEAAIDARLRHELELHAKRDAE